VEKKRIAEKLAEGKTGIAKKQKKSALILPVGKLGKGCEGSY